MQNLRIRKSWSCVHSFSWIYSNQIRNTKFKYNKVEEMFVSDFNPIIIFYYANMPVQYTAIFHGYKNDYFQMKNCNIFLIFAQNIDCGYTLEPPQSR